VGGVAGDEMLRELHAMSAEIEHAAILDADGAVLAASAAADGERFSATAFELLEIASHGRLSDAVVARVEIRLPSGSVFVVRSGRLVAVATTSPEPAAALVVHDLRACLDGVAQATKGRPPTADVVDA
jgi:predicted regulator of Ras-like GTPase activity (Roadblock/LC7/MglB family)